MNLRRYQWPVIVAASLHCALFLLSPESKVRATERVAPAAPLQPIPEELIRVEPPEDPSEDATPAGSAAAPRALPDTPPLLKPDPSRFIVPETDRAKPEITQDGLKTIPMGPTGVGIESNVAGTRAIFSTRDLDRLPRATAQLPPDYPHTMQQAGQGGTVVVMFEVGIDGRVTRAEAVSFTQREFVEPALRAVRNWRFEPGKKNGRAVSFRMTVPIEFNSNAN